MKKTTNRTFTWLLAILLLVASLSGCAQKQKPVEPPPVETETQAPQPVPAPTTEPATEQASVFDYSQVPPYTEYAYAEINDNVPYFTPSEITTEAFEDYAPLDTLGRCQTAFACLGPETLPTQKRQSISHIKPTGWQTVKYPEYISDNYLYNRCHLIAHELAAEDDNKQNLVTGTRYMNVTGMLPFENNTAYYIKATGNHVMYRVTPVFIGNELVCRGVLMEGYSVEDEGESIEFCIFYYNVQPFITINYTDGTSQVAANAPSPTAAPGQEAQEQAVQKHKYILNTNSKKIHMPDCSLAEKISEKNKKTVTSSINDLYDQGYTPCGSCRPDEHN